MRDFLRWYFVNDLQYVEDLFISPYEKDGVNLQLCLELREIYFI
tara:strand:- start:118 stop:249 length:132 start_codon:yes stop_codon:yes gene_type:complete